MQAIFTKASAEEGSDLVVLAQSSRLAQPGKILCPIQRLGLYLEDVLLAALDLLHVPAEHALRTAPAPASSRPARACAGA